METPSNLEKTVDEIIDRTDALAFAAMNRIINELRKEQNNGK